MQLYQPKNGYCYNSDTYCLYDFISKNLEKFKNIHGELLDIGAGSGILGFFVKQEFDKLNLNSCELQDEFAILCKKNGQINNINLNLYHENFIDFNFDKKFDIIVSNPPFYPSSVVQTTNINKKIARYNDNLPLDVFITKTSQLLNTKGKFFFCYDVKLLNDIILLLKQNNLNLESVQFLHPNINKDASLVMIYARKDSKSLVSIKKPFIMFKNDSFTKEMQDIYNKCKTQSIKVEL